MRHIHLKRNKFYCPTINVEALWTLVGEDVRKKYEQVRDVAPVIDAEKKVGILATKNFLF